MSEKDKIAVYYRKTNDAQSIGIEQQKEMLKGAAVFSGNKFIEDYCDEQGEESTQFDKMFVISRKVKLQLLLF